MLRNNARHDSLDPRYNGIFEVTDRKGPNVKLSIKREMNGRHGERYSKYRNKWVHLNRCKEYLSPTLVVNPHHEEREEFGGIEEGEEQDYNDVED